jgi:hypothetical protein
VGALRVGPYVFRLIPAGQPFPIKEPMNKQPALCFVHFLTTGDPDMKSALRIFAQPSTTLLDFPYIRGKKESGRTGGNLKRN